MMRRYKMLRLITLVLLALLAVGCAVLLFATDKGFQLRHNPRIVRDWVESQRVLVALAFLLAYIVMSLVCMPVWWLQILAGYCFGIVPGILMIEICSMIAAVATSGLSHWLAGSYVREKLKSHEWLVRRLTEKVGNRGMLVVIAVRLAHVVPFGLANYFFGLTRIRQTHVALGSLIGGIPAAAFYATLGASPTLF